MNNKFKSLLITVLTAFWIIGCPGNTKPNKKIDFYTLEYDSPKISNSNPLPIVIQIDRFQVTPLYDSKRISYSETPFTIDTFKYHKWQADPGELVTYFLARDLKQSSLFKAVFTLDSNSPSSHRLSGIVDEFYEQDRSDLWEAVLTVSITLITEDEQDLSKRILMQKKYNSREECKYKNPRAIAEAMSRAMAKVSKMIITDIYNRISGGM